MLRRKLILSIVVPALVVAGAGCGSDPRPAATVSVSSPTSATSTTAATPVADATDAVAALDGSIPHEAELRRVFEHDRAAEESLEAEPLLFEHVQALALLFAGPDNAHEHGRRLQVARQPDVVDRDQPGFTGRNFAPDDFANLAF